MYAVPWSDLPGWPGDSCSDINFVLKVLAVHSISELEKLYTPYIVLDDQDGSDGTFTGYYEPIIKASKHKSEAYKIPIYKRPEGLLVIEDLGYFRNEFKGHRIAGTAKNGTLVPFHKSREIWRGDLLSMAGLEIAWANNIVDVYFMHVQGSGRLEFEDGKHLSITYDGTNGFAYTSLRKIMIEKGLLRPDVANMESLRAILNDDQERAIDLISDNDSYVFFKAIDSQEPMGRFNTPLIKNISLAVDPIYHPYNSIIWVDSEQHRGLMLAHDVGAAIKGPIRGDIFCGSGNEGALKAGNLKSCGKMYRIIPNGP
jgi:membrane-bound lytic murein transglycosylase A